MARTASLSPSPSARSAPKREKRTPRLAIHDSIRRDASAKALHLCVSAVKGKVGDPKTPSLSLRDPRDPRQERPLLRRALLEHVVVRVQKLEPGAPAELACELLAGPRIRERIVVGV